MSEASRHKERDIKFGQVALSIKLVDSQTLTYCVNLMKSMPGKSLSEVMMERGILNSQQVNYIHNKLGISKIPIQIGRYKIIEEIGRGGMGIIYKVEDSLSGRIVAMKVLIQSSRENNARFLREAKATSRLSHPNIVTLYDIGQDNDHYFFTMDFIDGVPLDEFIKSDATMSVRKIAMLMVKVCDAIHFAHEQGIIHRDIKPANIMMGDDGEPKVMDFGLAKLQDASQKLSMSGTMIGTIFYMPPEQVEGRIGSIDERSDVYSLGALLYTLLTGRPPFSGNTIPQVSKQILEKDPLFPSQIKQLIPKSLDFICLRALSKKKEARYQSADQLRMDLQKFLRGEKIAKDKSQRNNKVGKWLVNNSMLLAIFFIIFTITTFLFINSYNSLQSRYIDLYEKKQMGTEILFVKSFECYVNNKLESGWSIIDSLCKTQQEPRYHLLKALYIFTMSKNVKDQRISSIVNKYFPLSKSQDNYTYYIKGRLYVYNIIAGKDNIVEAMYWYKKGVKNKFAPCIESLGTIHIYNPRLQNYQRARKLFTKASPDYHWATFFLGHIHHNGLGLPINMDKAIAFYSQAANQGSSAAMVRLGEIYQQQKKYQKAVEWLEKAIAENQNGNALFILGKMYFEGNGIKKNSAKGLLLLNMASHKKVAGSYLYLARAYIEGQHITKNYSLALQLLQQDKGNPEVMYLLGELYYYGWGVPKNKTRAQQLYRKSAAKNFSQAKQKIADIKNGTEQKSVFELYELGLEHKINGKRDKALEYFDKVIALKPDYIRAYRSRSGIYYARQQWKEADENNEKILELDPYDDRALYNKGIGHRNNKRYEKAIFYLKKVIKINPQHPRVHFYLGDVYQKQQKYQLAIDSYTIAAKVVPSVGVYQSSGFCYYQLKKYEEAIAMYNRALFFKKDVSIYLSISTCHKQLKNYQKSVENLTLAIQINPSEPSYYNSRAHGYMKWGKYQEALVDIDRALQIEIKGTFLNTRSEIYNHLGEYKKAVEETNKSLKIKKIVAAYYHRAFAFYQLGDYKKAKQNYKRALSGKVTDGLDKYMEMSENSMMYKTRNDMKQFFIKD